MTRTPHEFSSRRLSTKPPGVTLLISSVPTSRVTVPVFFVTVPYVQTQITPVFAGFLWESIWQKDKNIGKTTTINGQSTFVPYVPWLSHHIPTNFPSFSHEFPIIFPWLSYSTWPFLGLHLPVLDIPPLPAIPAAQAPSQVRHLHQGLHYSCRGHVQIGIQQEERHHLL